MIGSKTHQSTPSGRSPPQDCCLRGNNTDLATHLRKWINQTSSIKFWYIIFAHTCAVITEFQSQEACLLISCSIAIFSFQGFVPQWPGEGGLQQSAFRARSGFLKEFNTSGFAYSFFVFVSYDIVYVRTSGCLKRILTSGFASTEHFSKRSVPSTEWVTMQDGGKRTDKVIVVSSVPWIFDARQV